MASMSESSGEGSVRVIVVDGNLFDLLQQAVVDFLARRVREAAGLARRRSLRAARAATNATAA